MSLDLDALSLIELIERRGSFAAAAASLNKAPSAITYQLRQLEDSLDCLIYDRSGHKAKLTPAGQLLLSEGRLLLDASEALTRKVKAVSTGWETELTLAVEALIPFEHLVPLLKAFDELKAPTRLRIISEVLSGSWEALHTGRAQLLLGAPTNQSEYSVMSRINLKIIGQSRFVFAVSPCHPLASLPSPLSTEQISAHRVVAVGDTSRLFKPLTRGVQEGQQVLTVPTLKDKIHAQLSGLGCGWVPWHMAKHLIETGDLIVKEVVDTTRHNELCAAWLKGSSGRALQWWLENLHRLNWNWID